MHLLLFLVYGYPAGHAMDKFDPKKDFSVLMGTKKQSRKVAQIRANPTDIICYLADEPSAYLLIKFRAK